MCLSILYGTDALILVERKYMKILPIIGIFAISAFSAIRKECQLQYQTNDGWSKVIKASAIFASGNELNEVSNTAQYNCFNYYAVVSINNQSAILQFKNYSFCMSDFDAKCYDQLFAVFHDRNMVQVNSENKINWKLTPLL